MDVADVKSDVWIPAQTSFFKEMVIATFLQEKGIEYYIPMKYELIEAAEDGQECEERLVPAIHNLLFIHHAYSRDWCVRLQQECPWPLFFMKRERNGSEYCTIPAPEMQRFIRASDPRLRGTRFVEAGIVEAKKGDRVRIIKKGPLYGIEGKFIRYGSRHYIAIEVSGSAALLKVAYNWCEKILTDE